MQLSDKAVGYVLLDIRESIQLKGEDLDTFLTRVCQTAETIRRQDEFRDIAIWVVIQGCAMEKYPTTYFRALQRKARALVLEREFAELNLAGSNELPRPHPIVVEAIHGHCSEARQKLREHLKAERMTAERQNGVLGPHMYLR